jgi:putative endonuclease
MEHNPTQVIDRVADYLKGRGLQILDRDWHHAEGMIPLVMTDHRRCTLIVCAIIVQKRGVGAVRIGERRRQALRRLAVRWLNAHGMAFEQVRVDLVSYIQDGPGGFTIEHTEGVA